MKKIIYSLALLAAGAAVTSCHNSSWDFPDYDYTTVYFAYQYPVRTIVLGEDIYDTTLDNEHKCQIMATMGGVYKNEKNRILKVEVDKSLADKVYFADRASSPVAPVKVMPDHYYTLPSDMTITIPKGKIAGGIEVQLEDAFFDDPEAITNTYVIPMRITSVQNADSILSGSSLLSNPNIHNKSEWTAAPKDYILYCIKYINPWHAHYLRRGRDEGKGKNGNTALDVTTVRHAQYVEKNEVCNTTTRSMNQVEISLSAKDPAGQDLPFSMVITFDAQENCTVKEVDGAAYSVSGTGKYVYRGDKNSWGNEDRDVLYLDYTVDFADVTYAIKDTLTYRDRSLSIETFTPVVVP